MCDSIKPSRIYSVVNSTTIVTLINYSQLIIIVNRARITRKQEKTRHNIIIVKSDDILINDKRLSRNIHERSKKYALTTKKETTNHTNMFLARTNKAIKLKILKLFINVVPAP